MREARVLRRNGNRKQRMKEIEIVCRGEGVISEECEENAKENLVMRTREREARMRRRRRNGTKRASLERRNETEIVCQGKKGRKYEDI